MRPLRVLLTLLFASASGLLCFAPLDAADAPPLEIRDGDRVLFLGDTLLERENTYGYLETSLTEHFRDRHFTVRNLSWSGDTPQGIARAMFDGPPAGWQRLKEQIATVKPTVVFLGYGMAASLQEITDRSGDITLDPDPVRYGREPMSAARFKKELSQLMDAIEEGAKAYAAGSAAPGTDAAHPIRFILLSPIRHEDLSAQRPGLPAVATHNQLLEGYTQAIAELARERGAHFVSLQKLIPEKAVVPLTTNGIHLDENGYHAMAASVAEQLGWPSQYSVVGGVIQVPPLDLLRQTIIRKNELFFHRFRPENWTYLFGFRKHEQGKNAVEIPEFDPLIAHEEEEIERLKKAAPGAAPAPKLETAAPAPAPLPEPPPAELPKFDLEKGFQIQLWATNPLVEKPIEMNWDSDGRLWIASSNTYPQVNPEDVAASLESQIAKAKKDAPSTGNDKIIIVEDPGHTGKAVKSTVFAEGLLIPTGVAPFQDAQGRWGCYVGASTELVQLVDTTGQGKADRRRIILSGFGTEDTHHIVHALRWGPDGQLYFNQSIYIHSNFETPWGMVRANSGAVISWDPRTERVEVHYKGFCNPWGHAWDEWGEEFMSDGAGGEGVAWGIPEAMYFTYENGRKLAQSISPGSYPKFASLEIIHSPSFPADWQGSFITNDFRAHRIVHFGVNDLSKTDDPAKAQSGYITKELPDLVRTSDLSFRPIDVKQGPDGALYVADWDNPVINHGEVDFRDPRRDHHSGRIWRISLVDQPPLAWKKPAELSDAELLPKLLSTSEWDKEHARIALRRRLEGPKPDAALENALHQGLKGETGKPMQLESAWLASGTPALRPEVEAAAVALLSGPGHENYAAAVRLLEQRGASFPDSIARFSEDPAPRVRVEAMRALARIPSARSAALVLDAALKAPAGDPFYEYAAWLSINDLAQAWTQAVISGEWKPEGREKQFEFALNSIDPALGNEVLSKVIGARGIPADGGPWIELIAKAGGPAELRKLFDDLVNRRLDPAASERAVDALREAARLRNVRPAGDLSPIETLLASGDLKILAGAARLIGAWKLSTSEETLKRVAASAAPLELHLAAIDGLRDLGGAPALADLQALLHADQAPEVRRAALVAVAELNLPAGVASAGEVLDTVADEKTALETWRALLQIKGAPEAFAARLPANLPPAAAAAGLRAARESGKKGEALANAFAARSGATPAAAAAGQDYQRMMDLVKRDGDPAHGETIFRRPQLACLACHAIGGAGGKVGPELTSLGASAPLDYIIESVLVPNAKVKEGYNALSLTLKDGTIATGIQTHETAQEIFLRNAAGQETGVPKANITARENIGSIMPAGLVDPIPERERLDLYAFLAQLGKPGVYDASKGNVARYWAIYPASADPAGLIDPRYKGPVAPGYTLVDGRLTRELLQGALQALPGFAGDALVAVAKFQIPAAGNVSLHLGGGAEAWLDGKPASGPNGVISANLTAGEHTIALKLNLKQLPEIISADCADARFLGN